MYILVQVKQDKDCPFFRPTDFTIKLHTIKSRWSILFFIVKELQVIIKKNPKNIYLYFPFSEDQFCLSQQCRP